MGAPGGRGSLRRGRMAAGHMRSTWPGAASLLLVAAALVARAAAAAPQGIEYKCGPGRAEGASNAMRLTCTCLSVDGWATFAGPAGAHVR